MNLLGIIIAVAVLVTVSTIVIIYSALENNIAQQNQAEKLLSRVHQFTDNGTKYVKINDLSPNSAFIFLYPYTGDNITDRHQINEWSLIRLAKDLGGDKDDISSFRAYSIIDIDIGCPAIYRPHLEKIQEPCDNNEYEPVNGIAVVGRAMYHKYNALPNLDLGIDDQGYIYVKPPTFEFDKNGVVGIGRQVQNSSSFFSGITHVLGSNYTLPYTITGGKLVGVSSVVAGQAYDIFLQPTSNGTLDILIPENLIQGKIYTVANYSSLISHHESNDIWNKDLLIPFNEHDYRIWLYSENAYHDSQR